MSRNTAEQNPGRAATLAAIKNIYSQTGADVAIAKSDPLSSQSVTRQFEGVTLPGLSFTYAVGPLVVERVHLNPQPMLDTAPQGERVLVPDMETTFRLPFPTPNEPSDAMVEKPAPYLRSRRLIAVDATGIDHVVFQLEAQDDHGNRDEIDTRHARSEEDVRRGLSRPEFMSAQAALNVDLLK